ncbi:unnamed protein product [Paramecium sonneborni]|uniref:Protein kinase domain-containing protein n=1 Tax=Paramecium sonneborni TaxID=65129 RepID=A0A8S1MYJ1_9CILI|nr:unnamed protein product [Paramecium sonneborni]
MNVQRLQDKELMQQLTQQGRKAQMKFTQLKQYDLEIRKYKIRLGEPSIILYVQDIRILLRILNYILMRKVKPPIQRVFIIKKRPLKSKEIKVIIKQLLLEIQHSHFKGICHRDLKPNNIFVYLQENITPPHVKLVDFGVSRRFISIQKKLIFGLLESFVINVLFKGFLCILINYQILLIQMDIQRIFNYSTSIFEIGTTCDVIALINKNNVQRDNCERCRSLVKSLKIKEQLEDVIKKLQNSSSVIENISINDRGRDFVNFHIIQRHTDKCGLIQLMNSVRSSNAFMNRSCGLQFCGSSKKTIHKDPFGDVFNIQSSIEMKVEQHNQNNGILSQLGSQLRSYIGILKTELIVRTTAQQKERIISQQNVQRIKEVDEITEHQS